MNSKAKTYAFTTTEEKLRELFSAFGTKTTYYLMQRPENICLREGIPEDLWQKGQLFNADYELRWEKRDNQIDALLLTEIEFPLSIESAQIRWEWQTTPTLIVLWGTWNERMECWIETRIPRRLEYPVSQAKHVKLEAVHYSRNGITYFTRFKEVKRYEEKE